MGAVFFLVLVGELIEVVVETIKADKAGAFDLSSLPNGGGLDGLGVDQLIEFCPPNSKCLNCFRNAKPLGLWGVGGVG